MRGKLELARSLVLAAAVASANAEAQPNDPLFDGPGQQAQWNLRGTPEPSHPEAGVRGIDAEGAWLITPGRPDVVIAVLDSGVRLDHPDLANNIAVNVGEAAAVGLTDTDGDGALTVGEIAALVPDVDGDGIVSGLDVLAHASNGVDDDGNGYVDDLVGWDFHDDDNDPTDVHAHGTGRAGIAAAVWNNAIGMVGVCPECSILPVRMGRTFVAVPDKLAAAIGYATDRGAASTVMATGSLGNSKAQRAAVAYADERGVVQCAAIGNERSRHHHLPQIYDEVIAVTGLKPDHPETPTSYSATWMGSNFGAHASVAAPTFVFATQLDGTFAVEGGTSSSVPHCAGVAALVVARARDLGVKLTARQIREIMETTADDAPSWSATRGYGRMNARAAVEAVSGTLPLDARIVSPRFYDLVAPGPISAELALPAGASAKLELGYGVEPDAFVEVDSSSFDVDPPAVGNAIDDVLGDAFAVTLQLTASDGDRKTVDRKSFFAHRDPDLVEGFPVSIGASAEGGPLVAQIDGRPGLEIAIATSDGEIVVLDAEGKTLPGWPAQLDPSPIVHAAAAAHESGAVPSCCAPVFAPLAAGDLDADGTTEIVATALDGKLYVFESDGKRRSGFPRDLGAPIWAAPVLADLDGDGALEIVAASYERELFVIEPDGSTRAPFPIVLRDDSATAVYPGLVVTPAVADLDADGELEIVVATSESSGEQASAKGRVYALSRDGEPLPGFPLEPFGLLPETFPVVGSGVAAAPVLADLDANGDLEIIAGHAAGQLAAFDHDGQLFAPFDHGAIFSLLSPYGPPLAEADPRYNMNALLLAQPVAADLDADGLPELVSGTMGLPEVDISKLAADPGEALASLHSLLTVWSADGRVRPPFPLPIEGWTLFASSSIVDVDGDGAPEMLTGSDGGWLHAFRIDGSEAAGYPRFAGGWLTAVSAGDLDADGLLEVVATTREGMLLAWRAGPNCSGDELSVRSLGAHHDTRNTGDPTLPIEQRCGAGDASGLEPAGGCGACTIGGARDSARSALGALVLCALLLGRRRR